MDGYFEACKLSEMRQIGFLKIFYAGEEGSY